MSTQIDSDELKSNLKKQFLGSLSWVLSKLNSGESLYWPSKLVRDELDGFLKFFPEYLMPTSDAEFLRQLGKKVTRLSVASEASELIEGLQEINSLITAW